MRVLPPNTRCGSMATNPTGNKLLDGLAANDLERLLPHFEKVSLGQRQTINTAGQAIEHAYFPTTGVVSLVA